MRNIIVLQIVLFCTLLSTSSIAQTQTDLNRGASTSFTKADQKLNVLYNRILNEYKPDTLFTQSLKASQRIWIKFRDAELKMMYPYTEGLGSIQPMCEGNYLEKLTNERIKTLQQWITGTQEGDACSGSIKVKD